MNQLVQSGMLSIKSLLQSSAEAMNLKFQLQTLKKGNDSVEDYLMKMKGYAKPWLRVDILSLKKIRFFLFLLVFDQNLSILLFLLLRNDSYIVKAASPLLLACKSRALQQHLFPKPPMTANVSMHSKRQ